MARRKRRTSYSRENQLVAVDNTDLIIGSIIGVAVIGTVAYIAYASGVVAEATSALGVGASWPTSEFATSAYMQQSNNQPGSLVPGMFVLLNDAPTGLSVIAQVTSVSGTTGWGSIVYVTPGASESIGDSANFYIADVLSSASSLQQLQQTQLVA
jgi:hypothetical protein